METSPHHDLAGRLPDPVVVIGPDAAIRWANAAAERTFGRDLAEVLGAPALELVHPDDAEFALLAFTTVQEKVAGNPIEVRIRAVEGWRLVEVVGAPLGDGSVALCLRDLTQRRRYEVAHGEEARFRSLVHNAGAVTMLLGADGRIESISAAVTRLTGHDPEHVLGRPLAELLSAERDRDTLAEVVRTTAPGSIETVVVDVRTLSGHALPMELTVNNLLDDPTVAGLVVTGHDVAERTAADRELRSTLSLLEATLDATADGILVVGLDGSVTRYNRRFLEMWRIPDEVIEAGDDRLLLDSVLHQLADPAAFLHKVEELYATPDAESDDTLEFSDGRVFDRYSTPQRVDGEIVGRVWCFHDETEHKRLENELVYRAFHDQLTGLANKARFCDRLQHAATRARRVATGFAVLFLDLDNFKTVNDSLGHHAGDQLLVSAARILTSCLRAADTPARLGGDEFAILMEDVTDPEDSIVLARRIRDAFQEPFRVARHEVAATVSIGIAFGSHDTTSEQILRDADLAMYMAKSRGKNRYELFERHQHDAAVVRVELGSELRQAIARDELVLFYQPIVDLVGHRIVATEALVRWEHPDRGLLLPASFVPLAEELGLIEDLGRRVLARACREMAALHAELGIEVPVSVNVSAAQLVSPGFAPDVAAVVRASGLEPADLILEITETAMLHDAEAARRVLTELRDLGVGLALDDFGTGYSSLTFLQHFPIDIVKIDKSFVARLDDARGQSLAPSVIRLAQGLGLVTVAEGVETPGQLEQLRALHCDQVQGFLLHRPYTLDGLRRRLTDEQLVAVAS